MRSTAKSNCGLALTSVAWNSGGPLPLAAPTASMVYAGEASAAYGATRR
jgi:hypothetical protein